MTIDLNNIKQIKYTATDIIAVANDSEYIWLAEQKPLENPRGSVTIATWNIHYGVGGINGSQKSLDQSSMDGVSYHIKQLNPDIIGLNECDFADRTKDINGTYIMPLHQPNKIQELTNFELFGYNFNFQFTGTGPKSIITGKSRTGEVDGIALYANNYGNAIRFDLKDLGGRTDSTDITEVKTFIMFREFDGLMTMNMHLTHHKKSGEPVGGEHDLRAQFITKMNNFARDFVGKVDKPLFLFGDMNIKTTTRSPSGDVDYWKQLTTYFEPVSNPQLRTVARWLDGESDNPGIDHIMVWKGNGWDKKLLLDKVISNVVDASDAYSDHKLTYAVIPNWFAVSVQPIILEKYVYDGYSKSISVPRGLHASPIKIGPNAGTYTITVKCCLGFDWTGSGSMPKTITVTITKGTFTLDNIVFEDKEFEWDGSQKRLTVPNIYTTASHSKEQSGIIRKYTYVKDGKEVTTSTMPAFSERGTYEITATFSLQPAYLNNWENNPPSVTRTLKIV